MEANQLKTQENQPEDSKALAELLNQQKVKKKKNPSRGSTSQQMLSFLGKKVFLHMFFIQSGYDVCVLGACCRNRTQAE